MQLLPVNRVRRHPLPSDVFCILTMTEIHKTMSGTSLGLVAQNELINWPRAAPSGFAKVATAVALVLPRSENQRSLYLVGALRQNGCARPIRIWPNMETPKIPPCALAPA